MPDIQLTTRGRLLLRWRTFWLARSGPRGLGRTAAWLACLGLPPFHGRAFLADTLTHGFIAPTASVTHPHLQLGACVFIGDRVVVSSSHDGGPVELNDRVKIYGNSFLHTGEAGSIVIGAETHIQPGCHIHSFIGAIRIGEKVEIAADCAFYNYDHGVAPGIPIMDQPLASKGDIVVGDGAWIGHRSIILQGVTIGEGAVIGAGSVVVRDVPANAIAAGVPAKVIRFRNATALRPAENNTIPIRPELFAGESLPAAARHT